MTRLPPGGLARASRQLAALTVSGSLIGFGYDSLVVLTLGAGAATDAYFLALGVVVLFPVIQYLAATNVVTPLLASSTWSRAQVRRTAWIWAGIAGGAGALLFVFRTRIAEVLAGTASGAHDVAACLSVLAVIPLVSSVSEFRRARLLAAGCYEATGWYTIARNLSMGAAALLVRPRSAFELGICALIGYLAQAIVVQWFRVVRSSQELPAPAVDLARPAVAGLWSQGVIYAVGYAPIIVERAVAARLGTGLPTMFGYSYRIVSMLGSVAITSATIPAMAALSGFATARNLRGLQETMHHLVEASARLAVPAVLAILAVALPAGAFLAPRAPHTFAAVFALYGVSLAGWILLRPWSALVYARGAFRPVLLMTIAQAGAAVSVALIASRTVWQVLASGPVVGVMVGTFAAAVVSSVEDWRLVRESLRPKARWIAGWVGVALAAAVLGAMVLLLSGGRWAAFIAGSLVGAAFLAGGLLMGLWTSPALAVMQSSGPRPRGETL